MAWLNARPDAPTSTSGKAGPQENIRRDDIEQYAGRVISPDVSDIDSLFGYFFRMGPATTEGPLDMREVRSWAAVLIGHEDWPAWQAEMFVRLSREYCAAQHAARDYHAVPPWPGAVKMWAWVRAQQMDERVKRNLADPVPKKKGRV